MMDRKESHKEASMDRNGRSQELKRLLECAWALLNGDYIRLGTAALGIRVHIYIYIYILQRPRRIYKD